MNTFTDASNSVATNVYNNLSDGNWGNCCTTATQLFIDAGTGYPIPNNVNVFNNVAIQYGTNTAPAWEYGAATGLFANNTAIGVATTPSNVNPVVLYGNGITFENNVLQNYGQYVVAQPGTTFTVIDYNTYGSIGVSGNAAWSYRRDRRDDLLLHGRRHVGAMRMASTTPIWE